MFVMSKSSELRASDPKRHAQANRPKGSLKPDLTCPENRQTV